MKSLILIRFSNNVIIRCDAFSIKLNAKMKSRLKKRHGARTILQGDWRGAKSHLWKNNYKPKKMKVS